MSESNGKPPVIESAWCAKHERMISDIHLAVCGNEELGVDGLVKDVRSLKSWRRKQDLRSATVAGVVTGAMFVIRNIFTKT